MINIQNVFAESEMARGYVYRGEDRSDCWFKATPQNIASFIMNNQDADSIVITDPLDRLVLNTFGGFVNSCPDPEMLSNVADHLVPMQMGKTAPLAVVTYSSKECNQGYTDDEPAVVIYREGDDDFTLWDVFLPSGFMKQAKERIKITADSIETLFKEMPVGSSDGDRINLLVWSNQEIARYPVRVGDDFIDQLCNMGCSVRGDLESILEELEAPEQEIDIMWSDLRPETQERLLRMLGDMGNYDVVPIATISAPEMEQGMTMHQ